MRILRAKLKNFMSHNSTDIDLSNIKLAAIVGENGAGKSSILEALSYALFGITRMDTDDELCRNGNDLESNYTFELNNEIFNVVRSKKFGKSGKLSLFRGDEKLTGTTMSETQDKIEKILNADYTTFINSAFIMQDEFNEFIIDRTSSEKDEILMSFLNINKYSDYCSIAKDKLSNIEIQIKVIEDRISNINLELNAELDPNEKELLQGELNTNKESKNYLKNREQEFNKQISELQSKIDNLQTIVDNKFSLYNTIDKLNKTIQSKNSSYINKDEILKSLDIIAKFDINKINKQCYNDLLEKRSAISSQGMSKKSEIEFLNKEIVKIEEILVKDSNYPNKDEMLKSLDKISKFDTKEINRQVYGDFIDKKGIISSQRASKESEIDFLKKEIVKLEELLATGKCYVCGSNITADHVEKHKKEINDKINTIAKEKDSLITQYNLLQEQVSVLSHNIDLLSAYNVYLEKQVKEKNKKEMSEKIGIAENDRNGLRNQYDLLQEQVTQLSHNIDLLNDYNIYKEIVELEKELKENQEKYQKLPEEPVAECIELKNKRESIQKDLNNLQSSIKTAESRIETIIGQISRITEKEDRLNKLNIELTENKNKLDILKYDKNDYDDIVKAFSKQGIPALIINNSLPIIENEANRLLKKFGSSFTIQFERKQDKKGSLEIYITNMGFKRKIKSYSGGEKIRIALAIRISLSRLLMLRNNCKIGLLVIDEPAGLDSRGLDEFINIITSLSSEYNQILIISHIDELTNAFPSTIFVSQGTSGSEVCIK